MAINTTYSPTGWQLAAEVARRLPRRLLRNLRPTHVLIAALAAASLVLTAGQGIAQAPTVQPDFADEYVRALQTQDPDGLLRSLATEARTSLALAGQRTFGPVFDAERRAATALLRTDHVTRATRLGRHTTPEGSFVVYAAERDTPTGTRAYPLIVWLDQEGRVVRTSP